MFGLLAKLQHSEVPVSSCALERVIRRNSTKESFIKGFINTNVLIIIVVSLAVLEIVDLDYFLPILPVYHCL